jgi:hypothetical protein
MSTFAHYGDMKAIPKVFFGGRINRLGLTRDRSNSLALIDANDANGLTVI